MKVVQFVGYLCVAVVVAVTVAVYQANHERRREGCERRAAIVQAFDAYTDALVAVPPRTPRTPDEQREADERVAAFRADLDERLAPLGPVDC